MWFVYNLGKRLKQLYANSTDPKDEPIQHLTWDYDYDEPPRLARRHASARSKTSRTSNKVMQEING